MRLLRDLIILSASIAFAVWLSTSGALEAILLQTAPIRYLDAIVAGAFFTSLFTVVPATVAIAGLARNGEPVWELALFGGLGAMLADLFILTIIKDTITDHLLALIRRSRKNRLKYFFRRGKTRFAGTLLGAVVIASPLPDELGLFLMGMARAPRTTVVLLAFMLNGIGIAVIALAARAL